MIEIHFINRNNNCALGTCLSTALPRQGEGVVLMRQQWIVTDVEYNFDNSNDEQHVNIYLTQRTKSWK